MKYKYKDLTREERGVKFRSSDFKPSAIFMIIIIVTLIGLVLNFYQLLMV